MEQPQSSFTFTTHWIALSCVIAIDTRRRREGDHQLDRSSRHRQLFQHTHTHTRLASRVTATSQDQLQCKLQTLTNSWTQSERTGTSEITGHKLVTSSLVFLRVQYQKPSLVHLYLLLRERVISAHRVSQKKGWNSMIYSLRNKMHTQTRGTWDALFSERNFKTKYNWILLNI